MEEESLDEVKYLYPKNKTKATSMRIPHFLNSAKAPKKPTFEVVCCVINLLFDNEDKKLSFYNYFKFIKTDFGNATERICITSSTEVA